MAVINTLENLALFLIYSMLGATICYSGTGEASGTTSYSNSCNAEEAYTFRLANATNSSEGIHGIIELCVKGTWGYICGTSWDLADANVACSSVGFTRAVRSFTEVSTEFANNKIYFYNVDCRGDEYDLFQCHRDLNLTGSCYLKEIAGAVCINDDEEICIPGLCQGDPDIAEPTCEPLTERCLILPWNDKLHCSNRDLGDFFLRCLSWAEILSEFNPERIYGVEHIELMTFEGNLLSIQPGFFKGFINSLFLYFDGVNITELQRGTFEGLSSLRILNLSSNSIDYLPYGVFDGLENLRMLDLSYNPLLRIADSTFAHFWKLEYLFLVDVFLPSIDPDMVDSLSSLIAVSASDSRICCLLADRENASCARTSPKSPLDTCGRLYPSVILRIFGWIIGLSALVGNIIVLILRFRQEEKMNVQTVLIINLAVADCLMGVYMLFITSADIHFGDTFFLNAPMWRDSNLCKVAGVLAFLSSELSVIALTLITFDRLLCILFPFGKYRLGIKVVSVIVVLMWVTVFVVGLVPFLLDSDESGIYHVYGLSDVCLGLPLHVDLGETGILRFLRESAWAEEFVVVYEVISSDIRPSWIYSVVIFIAVNMILFIFMLVCYILMFIQVKKSSRSVGNAEMKGRDIKVARKMAFIVATDFVCWMPIIVMGIFTQTGLVVLPSSLYAWTVIFILPINSSLNPVLYTFLNTKAQKKKPEKGKSNLQPISKNPQMATAQGNTNSSANSTKDTSA